MIIPLLTGALTVTFLLFSALFSGSETALFSIPRERLWRYRGSPSRTDNWVYRLLAHGQRTLLLILLGNLFVNVTLVGLIHALVRMTGAPHSSVLTMIVATTVILVFGEMLPKNLALRSNERTARLVAPILYHLSILLGPLLGLLQKLNVLFLLSAGRRLRRPSPFITLEELESSVAASVGEGAILPHERDVLLSILGRGSLPVSRLMVHRSQVVSVETTDTCAEALHRLQNSSQTLTIVLSHEDTAAVSGFVRVAKLTQCPARDPVGQHVEPAEMVPASMEAAEAVGLMIREGIGEVCALDEYGAYAGVLSLDGAMRALLGTAASGSRDEGGEGAVDSRAFGGLDDVEGVQAWLPHALRRKSKDVRTLNGLLVKQLGRIPQPGEEFAMGEFRFYIIEADQTVVRKVLITKQGSSV